MEQENTAPEGAAFEPRPLSDILRGDAAPRETEPAGRPEPEPAPQATAETGDKPEAPKAERPRDETGRFAPAPKDNGPPPEPKQEAPQTVPVAAVLEERKKRQALEQRLRELEARIAAPPAPQQPPVQAAPATPEVPLEDLMFQDPQRFIQAVRAPVEDQLVQTRIALSEQVARQSPDYVEAEAALVQHAQANPDVLRVVQHTLRTHPAPAVWALEQGRALLRQQKWGQVIQEFGSPEEYLAARAPQPVAVNPPPPAPPASLASVRSAGPRGGAAPWSGPTPLANILGPRR